MIMKILLACAAGMSTSLLVTRMDKTAVARGMDVEIEAMPVAKASDVLTEWDIVLLGPQVRFQLKSFEEKVAGQIPVTVINMRDYGTMNADAILDAAIKTLEEFR